MSHDLSRFRRLSLHVPQIGLLVDLSKSSLADDALTSDPLVGDGFPRAFAAMAELESGAVANPDEGRMVGHYWLRTPELAPDAALKASIMETVARVLSFAADVHSGALRPERADRFTSLLVVGIGGSALGPQLVADALTSPADRMRPFFFDNTDPDGMARELARIEAAGGIARTLTIVISKSGGTKETRNGMLEAKAAYEAAGLSFARHAVAVTGEGSELDRVAVGGVRPAGPGTGASGAAPEPWLARFPMWDWVGGRTSETSAVGLLPAALQGVDVTAFLAGARACDEVTRVPDVARNPAAMLALAWYRETDGRGAKDMVVLPYRDRLLLFSRYLQQLVMESLGKERDLAGNVVHQGLSVYGNKGSTDQHAYVQQLRDGVPNFFVTFVEVLEDREGRARSLPVEPDVTSGDYLLGFLLGTRRALHESGRRSVTLTLRDVSPRSLGMLIALYERTVGLYASLVGVNAYHQPGVEAGKKAASAVLALQQKLLVAMRERPGTRRTAEELAAQLGDDAETVLKVCEHLAANPDHGVSREPGASLADTRYFV